MTRLTNAGSVLFGIGLSAGRAHGEFGQGGRGRGRH